MFLTLLRDFFGNYEQRAHTHTQPTCSVLLKYMREKAGSRRQWISPILYQMVCKSKGVIGHTSSALGGMGEFYSAAEKFCYWSWNPIDSV